MTIKIFPWLLSAVLAILLFLQWEGNKRSELTASVATNNAKLALVEYEKARQAIQAHSDSVISFERGKRKSDSTIQAARTKVAVMTANDLRKGIDILKLERTAEGTQIDAKTAAIESKYDSLQKGQAREIEALQADKTLFQASHYKEVKALEQKLVAERETSLAKDTLLTAQSSQIEVLGKKNKRLGKTLKTLVPVLIAETVWIVIEAVKD